MSDYQAQIEAEMVAVTAALDRLLERKPPLSPAVWRIVSQWREVAAASRGHAKPSPPRPPPSPPDGDPRDLDHIV